MKFTSITKAISVSAAEVTSWILRFGFKAKWLTYDEAGWWVARFGNRFRLEGLTIHLDNPLLKPYFKGTMIADWYEKDERLIIRKYLPPHEPVIELGGSIGVVSCMTNHRLTSPTQHVVVEANPLLIPTLQKNRKANDGQFAIVESALGYGGDTITFFTNGASLLGSIYIGGGQKLEVPARTLQSIAEEAGFCYFTLISDIEGSEIGLVEHEIDFIREHVGWIFMELHEETPFKDDGIKMVIETLEANGFEVVDSIRNNYCFRNTASSDVKDA